MTSGLLVDLIAEKGNKTMTHFVYLRVSTDAQDVANQRHGVDEYCKRNGIKAQWIEDTASGKIAWRERKIGDIIDMAQSGDTVLVAEISRLGRSMLDILDICKQAADKGVEIFEVKAGRQLIGNAEAQMMLGMMAMFAEYERSMISRRTKEALARKKLEGVKLGRPQGEAEKFMLDDHAKQIKELLDKNIPKTSIAKIVGCSPTTLNAWLKKRGVTK
jgi:DNA invertase Pin-like site-specific DNA recombinase